MNLEEKRKFASGKWYQRIDLGDGVITNGNPDNINKWECIRQHMLLKDAKVLDLGCAEGYFCLKSLLGGAKSVMGIDFDKKKNDKFGVLMELFGVTNRILFKKVDLNTILRLVANFDIFPRSEYVIAMAIIHWLENPIGFLKMVKELTKKRAFVEFNVKNYKEDAMKLRKNKTKWYFSPSMCIRLMKLAGFGKACILKDYITSFGVHRVIVTGIV